MKSAFSATEARKIFFKLIKYAGQPGSSVTITSDGEPKVIMMSVEDFEAWQETLEIMSDPDLAEGIKQGLREIREGKLYSAEEVKKQLNL